MLSEDLFDRIGEHLDGASRARPGRREQDQSGVRFAACQAFRSERPEVLHVVRDDGPFLAHRDFEDHSVASSCKVLPLSDGQDIVAAVPEQLRDPRRELLIQERLHSRSARSPAAAASKPRWYSASLSSISASISSRYSP